MGLGRIKNRWGWFDYSEMFLTHHNGTQTDEKPL